jgi:hypothetical protein
LSLGQFGMVSFDLVAGDVDPEAQGRIHSEFHGGANRRTPFSTFYGAQQIRVRRAWKGRNGGKKCPSRPRFEPMSDLRRL